jgi:hypothetical protein
MVRRMSANASRPSRSASTKVSDNDLYGWHLGTTTAPNRRNVLAPIPTAVAHADDADDAFVKNLADQRISGDPGELVAVGRGVCDNVSQHATGPPRWARLSAPGPVMGSLQISAWQAEFVISAAESAYCPQYLGLTSRLRTIPIPVPAPMPVY